MADTTFSIKDPSCLFLTLSIVQTFRNSFLDQKDETFCKELSNLVERWKGIKL